MTSKIESSAAIERIYVLVEPDPEGDASYLEQDEFNDRLEQYHQGAFGFVGVRLAADIVIEHHGRVPERITLTTPGLWSVESDSGEDYFRASAAEGDDVDELTADLLALRFTMDEIRAAIPEDGYEIVYA